MLDLDNPQTPLVFEAVKIQGDLIGVVLKAKEEGRDELSVTDRVEVNHHIELLETLNFVGFHDDPGIKATLRRVRKAFNSRGISLEQLQNVFLEELAQPNHNFGTWAI